MDLRHLTDKTLLQQTRKLVSEEREVTLEILHHLKEIERRRAFSDLGYGSLFDYAIKELGYSESAANRRIQAARLLKDLPQIEKKISEGSLSLTNLTLAGQLFKNQHIQNEEEKLEILQAIENTTKRECEKELLKFSPTPPPPKEQIKQVQEDLHVLKFNVTQATLDLFFEIKNILAHNRLNNDEIMGRVLKIALPVLKNNKFKLNAKFTSPAVSPSISRYIPNQMKKEVYERDGGKCTKCGSKYKLEYDHIEEVSRGGKTSPENLRLLCFSCNQRRLK